ncbi:MAG TPA: protein-L-isoaspartate(D-aspartate) O-methyltransferase [Planctomycetota bacterium]|nr:protein-L-isoaspartate(D-aspartate) O-methyltransferase [Planctomycetota bacterium]
MTTDFREERLAMVQRQLVSRGVRDPGVLSAMRTVPRHEFVPDDLKDLAYDDRPLPIGRGQTISQPYIVALMTELAELRGEESVLEVGTGSGYQAAVLAELAARVYTIELVEPLLRQAAETLARLRYRNVFPRFGDGRLGWKEMAPFDAILVTAAPSRRVPAELLAQLCEGGRLVVPVGGEVQTLRLLRRRGGSFEERDVMAVRFVPLVGAAE